MNPVLWSALAGAGVGIGLIAIWVGATRPRRNLLELVRTLEHGSAVAVERGPSLWRSELARIRSNWSADLELCEQSPEKFLAGRLLLAIEFAVIPIVIWLLGGLGVFPILISAQTAMVLALVAGVGGWLWAAIALRNEAKARREQWGSSLAALIELIGLLVAGGLGLETATEQAASAGQGPVFRHINAAITAAATRREPPWPSLRSLGERMNVDDLIEFSESMALASEGARVADALVARAATVREREMHRELARAESASESMVVPVSMMLFGVLALIGFPVFVSMISY